MDCVLDILSITLWGRFLDPAKVFRILLICFGALFCSWVVIITFRFRPRVYFAVCVRWFQGQFGSLGLSHMHVAQGCVGSSMEFGVPFPAVSFLGFSLHFLAPRSPSPLARKSGLPVLSPCTSARLGRCGERREDRNSRCPPGFRPQRPLPSQRVPLRALCALSPSGHQGRLEEREGIKPGIPPTLQRAGPFPWSPGWKDPVSVRILAVCLPHGAASGRPRVQGGRGGGYRAGDPVSVASSGFASAPAVACCCWR